MPNLFDRPTFLAFARRAPFGNRMSKQQSDGLEAILSKWEQEHSNLDIRYLAYILATVFHETGSRMVPVREGFAKNDAAARKVVANRTYGLPDERTGHVYYGRGHVQLTWYENYKTMGRILGLRNELIDNPDLAMRPDISLRILFEGMLRGVSGKGDYTGQSLDMYFSATKDDPVGARRIINGTDKAALIAGYHRAFLDSLNAALAATADGRPDDIAETVKPDGANLLTDKTVLGAVTSGAGGLAATLAGAINNPWALAAFAVVALGVFLIITGRIEIKTKAGA